MIPEKAINPIALTVQFQGIARDSILSDTIKICLVCSAEFLVPKWRADRAKYCSNTCTGIASRSKPNTRCTSCGKEFHKKASSKTNARIGNFCSVDCLSSAKSEFYLGERNPNFRGKNTDYDGYLYTSYARKFIYSPKLHREVAFTHLGCAPENTHVHHRDCNVSNNDPYNLVVLTASDHKWLHKQFGNATLWAVVHEKINAKEVCNWSDNPERAKRLMLLDCVTQGMLINRFGYSVEDAISAYGAEVDVEIVEIT